MDTQVAGRTKDETSPDLARISDDLAVLKRDFAELIGHVRGGAMKGAGEAADALLGSAGAMGDKTRAVYDDLAAQAACSAKAIGGQVEQRPLISLLLAFGVGVLASRLLPR